MPGVSLSRVQEQTGFAFESEDPAPVVPPPSEAEIAALDAVDPDRVRDVEFH
jgi:hypothetical protein